MWEDSLIKKITEIIKNDSSGHDLPHSLRVRNVAVHIARNEGGNLEVLIAAAYLHDLFKGDPENSDKSKVVRFAEESLKEISYPLNFIPDVILCIKFHSWSDRHKFPDNLPLNVLIFQDADRLDAIGAGGVARTFAYGGSVGRPIGIPRGGNIPDGFPDFLVTRNTTIDHFYEKLLLLKDHLNTKTAKEIAENRHKFMVVFLDYLAAEWNGVR